MVAVDRTEVVDAVNQLDDMHPDHPSPPRPASTPAAADADFETFKAHAESIVDDQPHEPPLKSHDETAAALTEATASSQESSATSCSTSNAAATNESAATTASAYLLNNNNASATSISSSNNNDDVFHTPNSSERHCDAHPILEGVASAILLTQEERECRQQRFVSPKDFELLKVIGMGAFGKVLQVRNKRTQQVLAMKIISKRLLKRKGESIIENVLAERNILMRVQHPFVVTMHCSFQSREKLFIIMDFLAGGELFMRLGREGIFLEKTAAFYLAEIILALDHLHSKLGVLHRDLKPENILLGSDGHVCLTDFGLAKDFSGTGGFQNEDDESSSRAFTICGTGEYMAPEMVARKGYGRAADYWSCGCVAYEMLSGRPPFESKQGAKVLFSKIMTEKVKMPSGSSAAACKLLKGLLNRNVQARLGAARSTMFEVGGVAGLKQMEFFSEIDWDKLACKQIEPPAVFSVDNDGDVQYFHQEFTQMALPRSVMDMSTEDFQPHRIESKAFRGFSFIQDDFLLPERDQVEERSYWDSIEEDGESVSECASSKMGDVVENAQLPLSSGKRPPRKRKKKPADVVPGLIDASTPADTAANTPFGSALNTPEPSEAGDLPELLQALEINVSLSTLTKPVEVATTNNAALSANTQPFLVQKPVAPAIPTLPAAASAPSRAKPSVKETWQAAKKQDIPAKPKQRNNLNQNPNQRTPPPGQWATGRANPPLSNNRATQSTFHTAIQKTPPSVQRTTTVQSSTPQSNRATVHTSGSMRGVAPKRLEPEQYPMSSPQLQGGGWGKGSPAAAVSLPPQPNGWNSIASASQQQPVRTKTHEHPSAPPTTAPPSSSDWRNHQMGARDSNSLPGQPVVMTDDGPSWPSLGGNQSNPKVPTPTKEPAVKGAWAAKVAKS